MASFNSARLSFPADHSKPTRRDLAAGLWTNSLPGDLCGFYPLLLPANSYGAPSLSSVHGHPLPPMDFASNVPTLWGYQNLLGFLPHPLPAPNAVDRLTTPYVDPHQPHDQSHPKSNSVAPSNMLSAITPALCSSEPEQPPLDVMNQKVIEFAARSNKSSPVFKMFKCTLDPNCEMEFTRAEHLARHERKHTKEKPFQCHCSKSFSRLDNWRQHKVSVHRDQIEENALTEERLVQVHKSMQRQNNIRKVATLAAQRQGHLERSPSCGESLKTPHTPAVTSPEGSIRRHSCVGCLGQTDICPLSPFDQKPRRWSETSPVSALEFNTSETSSEALSQVPGQCPAGSLDMSPLSRFGTPPPNYSQRPSLQYSAPHESMPPSNCSPGYPTILGPMLIPSGSTFDMSTPNSNLSCGVSSTPMGKLNYYGVPQYDENQPCYSGYEMGRNNLGVSLMFEPGNTFSKKRELENDFIFEEEMSERERQRNFIKRMRI